MMPTIDAGAHLLVRSRSTPRVGDIVVALHPSEPGTVVVKRVASIDGDRFELRSDNASVGVDSRSFGSVARRDVIGVVTAWI